MRGKASAAERPSFVYVMRHDGGLTKIGIAHDPTKRQRQIANASGFDVEIVATRQFSTRLSAAAVERKLHKRFHQSRVNGEWFRTSSDVAVRALEAAIDPNLHSEHWAPGMPTEIVDNPLERWRWHRAKETGHDYESMPAGVHPGDVEPDGSVRPHARQFYRDEDLAAQDAKRMTDLALAHLEARQSGKPESRAVTVARAEILSRA